MVNLADGSASTDAATVGQVQSAEAQARSYAQSQDQQILRSAMDYTDTRFDALSAQVQGFSADVTRRVDRLDGRVDRIGAMGAAMAQMTASAAAIDAKNRIAVGYGHLGGASAMAIGYQQQLTDTLSVTLGGSFSGSETTYGGGFGFGW